MNNIRNLWLKFKKLHFQAWKNNQLRGWIVRANQGNYLKKNWVLEATQFSAFLDIRLTLVFRWMKFKSIKVNFKMQLTTFRSRKLVSCNTSCLHNLFWLRTLLLINKHCVWLRVDCVWTENFLSSPPHASHLIPTLKKLNCAHTKKNTTCTIKRRSHILVFTFQ